MNAAMASLRERMVREQLVAPGRNIRDPRVLAAMRRVARHEFVPLSQRAQAYEDHPLPIGFGQTISQPYIVAFMTEKLRLTATDRVLEIGGGCGYQTAVLAEMAQAICSLEIIPELARHAAEVLGRLGYDNTTVRVGDGHHGWPERELWDAILVACAPTYIPSPLVAQLKEGGRMVLPVGPEFHQELVLLEKRAGVLASETILPVRFVPMTGG